MIGLQIYKVIILPSLENCSFYTGSAHIAETWTIIYKDFRVKIIHLKINMAQQNIYYTSGGPGPVLRVLLPLWEILLDVFE